MNKNKQNSMTESCNVPITLILTNLVSFPSSFLPLEYFKTNLKHHIVLFINILVRIFSDKDLKKIAP